MFKWTDELKIDGGQIDAEHQELIRIANRMGEISDPDLESEEIRKVIHALYDYVRTHFSREEVYMEEVGFPLLQEHKIKHEAIISEMNNDLISAGNMGDVLRNFKNLVKRWVVDHITEEDLKIRDHLQNREQAADS